MSWCTSSARPLSTRCQTTWRRPSAVRATPGSASGASPACRRVHVPGGPAIAAAGASSASAASSRAGRITAGDASRAQLRCGPQQSTLPAMRELPAGTVTLLFTDVEGSTKLLAEHGDAYANLLAEHRRLLRAAFEAHSGVEVDTQGDAFFYAFARASDGASAAADGQAALSATPVRVRMGLHTGEPQLTEEGYVGMDVHRGARIAAVGHGGQVLVSEQTARLLDATPLRDLGPHRLKDVGETRIYQLGDDDFPPLKTLYQSNLPTPANPLVGRKKELVDVMRLLAVERARVVTLTGPGGTGKTRFSIAAAAECVDAYPDGVWFADLSPVRDPALVLPAIGAALGARGDVAAHIAEGEALIVLDTLEQVVGAAADLAGLVAACPRLQLLGTSREALRIAAEREYPLRPLPESPAVELLRQRADANGEI